jgi:hypothetical protein
LECENFKKLHLTECENRNTAFNRLKRAESPKKSGQMHLNYKFLYFSNLLTEV